MTKPTGGHQVGTACPLDCPDSCSLSVSLSDGRVVALDGGDANPVTGGYICGKVRRFGERMYGSDRLLRPGFRIGPPGSGEFRWVSWDEALARVADAMREARDRWGAESVLPYCYGGSNGLLTQDTTDARLFRRFGASRLARTLCASTTGAANQALYGKMPSVTYADYVHAKLIVIWGANPSASGIHLVPFIREAQRAGAALVVVDPRATPLARLADLHLAPQAGHGRRRRARAAPPPVRERPGRRGVPRGAHHGRRGAAGARARVDLRARGRGGRARARGHRQTWPACTPRRRRP